MKTVMLTNSHSILQHLMHFSLSATEVRILIMNNASENIKKIHIKAAVMQTEKPL